MQCNLNVRIHRARKILPNVNKCLQKKNNSKSRINAHKLRCVEHEHYPARSRHFRRIRLHRGSCLQSVETPCRAFIIPILLALRFTFFIWPTSEIYTSKRFENILQKLLKCPMSSDLKSVNKSRPFIFFKKRKIQNRCFLLVFSFLL
jgi:hypothetical protein